MVPSLLSSFLSHLSDKTPSCGTGEEGEGNGHRAEKVAEFFPRSDLGTRGFTNTDGSGNPKPTGSPELLTLLESLAPGERFYSEAKRKWTNWILPITGGLAPEYKRLERSGCQVV